MDCSVCLQHLRSETAEIYHVDFPLKKVKAFPMLNTDVRGTASTKEHIKGKNVSCKPEKINEFPSGYLGCFIAYLVDMFSYSA